MVYEALYELQQVFYYGSAQSRKTEIGRLKKTVNNAFDLEKRLFGENDGFLYLAVSMIQKDY